MKNFTIKKLGVAVLSLFVSFAIVGCEEKTPAQKVGDNLDKAANNAKDIIAPPSTAGEKIDSELDKLKGKK